MRTTPIKIGSLALIIATIAVVQPCFAISNVVSVLQGSDSMFVVQSDGSVRSTSRNFEITRG